MNEEDKGVSTPAAGENASEDPIKQLKGEFSRKTDKLAESMAKMQQTNEQLTATLTQLMQPRQPAAAAKQEDLASLMYSNPARYAELIEERAEARIMNKINTAGAEQNQAQSTIAALARDYPELNDTDSALTQKAVEYLNKMSAEDRKSPMSYRVAVREAAADLEVKPKSKRPVEDFGGSTNGYANASRRKPADKITPETEWAINELYKSVPEIDTTDPKFRARILERQKRDSWTSPKEPTHTKPKGRRN